ncbi:MAG: hypothetical protein PHP00_10045 [Thiotrichaceae bacterium]|nr:hypothetical protein [Thiotrichaceae bacterium]
MNTRHLGILGCFYLTACTHQLPLTTANSLELEPTRTAQLDYAYTVPRLIQFGDLTALNHYVALYQHEARLQPYVQQVKTAREQRCAREIKHFPQASFAEQAQYREACPAWLLQTPPVNYATKPLKTAPSLKPQKVATQAVVYLPPAQVRPPAQIIIANVPAPQPANAPKTAASSQINIMPVAEEKLPPLLDLLSNLNHPRKTSRRRRSR